MIFQVIWDGSFRKKIKTLLMEKDFYSVDEFMKY